MKKLLFIFIMAFIALLTYSQSRRYYGDVTIYGHLNVDGNQVYSTKDSSVFPYFFVDSMSIDGFRLTKQFFQDLVGDSVIAGNGLYKSGNTIEIGDSTMTKDARFFGNGTYGFYFGEEGYNPLSNFEGWISNQFRFTATSGTGLTFDNSSLDLSTSSNSGYEVSSLGNPIISAFGNSIFEYNGGTRVKSTTAPIWLGDSHVQVNIGSSTQNLSFLNAYSDNIIFNSDGFYQTNTVGNHQSNITGSGTMQHAANEHLWYGPNYSDHFTLARFLGDSLLYFYNDTGFMFGKHIGLKYVGVPETSITDSTLIPKWFADDNYTWGNPTSTNTITDNDATPDVSGAFILTYNGTANSVVVTDIDNPVVGATYRIIGNSDTYTITINDAGNFNLSANWVGGIDDVLTIYVQADNDYIEISRADN